MEFSDDKRKPMIEDDTEAGFVEEGEEETEATSVGGEEIMVAHKGKANDLEEGKGDGAKEQSETAKQDIMSLETETVAMCQDDVRFVPVDCVGGDWEDALRKEWESSQCLVCVFELEAFAVSLIQEEKEHRRGLCFFTHRQGNCSWRCVAQIGQLDPSVPRFLEVWEVLPVDEEQDLIGLKNLQLSLWQALLQYSAGFFIGAQPFTRQTQILAMGLWRHLSSVGMSNKSIALGISVEQVAGGETSFSIQLTVYHRCLKCAPCCLQT